MTREQCKRLIDILANPDLYSKYKSAFVDFKTDPNARGGLAELICFTILRDLGLQAWLQPVGNKGHDVIVDGMARVEVKQRTNKTKSGRSAWKVDNLRTARNGTDLAICDLVVVFETDANQQLRRILFAIGSDVVNNRLYSNNYNKRQEITQFRFERACTIIIEL